LHTVMGMAKVGQVGGFSIYVIARSKHGNNYVKIKGKGGNILGKFRLDVWEWENVLDISSSDRKKILAWLSLNLKLITRKIEELPRK